MVCLNLTSALHPTFYLQMSTITSAEAGGAGSRLMVYGTRSETIQQLAYASIWLRMEN